MLFNLFPAVEYSQAFVKPANSMKIKNDVITRNRTAIHWVVLANVIKGKGPLCVYASNIFCKSSIGPLNLETTSESKMVLETWHSSFVFLSIRCNLILGLLLALLLFF